MNGAIRRRIRKRNSMYRKARLIGQQSMMDKYKSLRNEVVCLSRQSIRRTIWKQKEVLADNQIYTEEEQPDSNPKGIKLLHHRVSTRRHS